MDERPKLNINLTSSDKVLEMIGWAAILAIWVLIITSYSTLPATIPTHYNSQGIADGFGEKGSILALPIIATILFIGMTILSKFPHTFNYPTDVTANNALKLYTNATKVIRILKLVIVVIFELIILQTIRNVKGEASGLGVWFLPLTLGSVFSPIIYFMIKSVRMKNKVEKME
jgi:uncharacterized membrane protein